MEVTYVKAHDAGIMTFSLDGDDHIIGSVDAYAPGSSKTPERTSRPSRLRRPACTRSACERTTKNAASSNYFGYLVWLRLVKQ